MNYQRNLDLSIRKVSAVAPKIQFIVIKFVAVIGTNNHNCFIQKIFALQIIQNLLDKIVGIAH